MTHDDLSAFENGVAQPVLNFPLEVEKSWDFSLFTIEWSAIVFIRFQFSSYSCIIQ